MRRSPLLAVAAAVAGLAAPAAGAPAGFDELSLPARLRSTLMIVNALPPGTVQASGGGTPIGNLLAVQPTTGANAGRIADRTAFLSFTIRRWSTDEEHAALEEAFSNGGTYALAAALDRFKVGELRFDNELRWPIRSATTWRTEQGQRLRLVTTGRLFVDGSPADSNQLINIVDLALPRGEKYGEGTLVTATEIEFETPGRMIPVTLALGTGTQRISNVERESKH